MKDEQSIQNLCLHTHNNYCDGKEDMNTLIKTAVSQQVAQIGISSHAPLRIKNSWSMEYNQLDSYTSEVERLKKLYKGKIEIFKSLEIDFIPNKTYSFDFFRKKMKLDYTIGSIHLVLHSEKDKLWFIDGAKKSCIDSMMEIFDGNVKRAVKSFFAQTREMIQTQKPDIIGHLDKVLMNTAHLFDINELWYQQEIIQTLELIRDQNIIIEVNTRGLYKGKWKEPFPSINTLQQCFEMGIPITISSDAHHSSELLLNYQETRDIIKKIGFQYLQGRKNGKWGNFPI